MSKVDYYISSLTEEVCKELDVVVANYGLVRSYIGMAIAIGYELGTTESKKEEVKKVCGINSPVVKLHPTSLKVKGRYSNVKKASDDTGVAITAILRCIEGGTKTAGQYLWKYENNSW
jgi:hypothetical protein